MFDQNIRWKDRFSRYREVRNQLEQALFLLQQRPLSHLEKLGLIRLFESTYELSWRLLRDYLLWQASSIAGSRDAIREAFTVGLISDGHSWMAMLQDRNSTVHTYDETTFNMILDNLKQRHAVLFAELNARFDGLAASSL